MVHESYPVWIMVHSGSRNLGFKICKHHEEIAQRLNERWHSKIDPAWKLFFLPIETEEAKTYLREMQYALEFAKLNREMMMNTIKQIMWEEVGCSFTDEVNIHHNYAAWEHHFGQNVLVHRKGATRAYDGERGIIPGSQGTASYIVEGLGNPESFKSCSHGAGRVLGRKEAQRTLDLEAEKAALDAKGILHSINSKVDLEEAPSAYKNIDEVIDSERDLVKPIVRLVPLAVIKGQESK